MAGVSFERDNKHFLRPTHFLRRPNQVVKSKDIGGGRSGNDSRASHPQLSVSATHQSIRPPRYSKTSRSTSLPSTSVGGGRYPPGGGAGGGTLTKGNGIGGGHRSSPGRALGASMHSSHGSSSHSRDREWAGGGVGEEVRGGSGGDSVSSYRSR